jgi:DNA-binding NarL/FixJ family response regulator
MVATSLNALTMVLTAGEDEPVLHHALVTLGRDCLEYKIVSSLAEGCQRLQSEPIDLVLIDVRFPSPAVVAAIPRFRQIIPDLRIVVYAGDQGRSTCVEAVAICRPDEPATGGSKAVHRIDARLPEVVHGPVLPQPVCLPGSDVPLSDRQIQILKHLAEGMSVKEIASKLKMSYKSVDSLKYRMMRRLRIHDRVDLARFAIREGLASL